MSKELQETTTQGRKPELKKQTKSPENNEHCRRNTSAPSLWIYTFGQFLCTSLPTVASKSLSHIQILKHDSLQ